MWAATRQGTRGSALSQQLWGGSSGALPSARPGHGLGQGLKMLYQHLHPISVGVCAPPSPTQSQHRCLGHLGKGNEGPGGLLGQGPLLLPASSPLRFNTLLHLQLFAQLRMFRALSVFALLPLFVLVAL